MTGDATHAATAVSRWLLDADVDGIGLTKTHVLQRETVREAARRWPWSWNHELFGPPHREAELSVLEAVHRGLRRMRLLRRQRDTLLTTARGRELLADPPALFDALHADLGAGDGIDKDAWAAIERVLAFGERLTVDGLFEQVGPVLFLQGWRDADCAPLTAHTLFSALVPLLSLAGGYGTIGRTFDTSPLTIELSEAGWRLASRPAPTGAHAAPPGAGAVVLDAELVNVRGVRARIAILEHQHLTAVHDTPRRRSDSGTTICTRSGWTAASSAVTTSSTRRRRHRMRACRQRTSPSRSSGCTSVSGSAYLFDFGDGWRVRLTVAERRPPEPCDHPRVVEVSGTPPQQYPAADD